MKQVDFYLIANRVADAKYKLASRLSNKLQRLDQRLLIITDDQQTTDRLDRIMWSFSDCSFLAHDTFTGGKQKIGQSILIGDSGSMNRDILEQPFDVLINLSVDVPLFNHHFKRIAEIVEEDESSKASARSRYKRYQDEGFELKTHSIEL